IEVADGGGGTLARVHLDEKGFSDEVDEVILAMRVLQPDLLCDVTQMHCAILEGQGVIIFVGGREGARYFSLSCCESDGSPLLHGVPGRTHIGLTSRNRSIDWRIHHDLPPAILPPRQEAVDSINFPTHDDEHVIHSRLKSSHRKILEVLSGATGMDGNARAYTKCVGRLTLQFDAQEMVIEEHVRLVAIHE